MWSNFHIFKAMKIVGSVKGKHNCKIDIDYNSFIYIIIKN